VLVTYSIKYPPEDAGGEQQSPTEAAAALTILPPTAVKELLQSSLDKVAGTPGRYTLTATIEVSTPSIVESQDLWSIPDVDNVEKYAFGTSAALPQKSMDMYQGNRFMVQESVMLSHFDVYIDVSASTRLDLYVHELTGGQHVVLWDKTVTASGFSGFISSGVIDVLLEGGREYVLGVGWMGEATNYVEKSVCGVQHGPFVFSGEAWHANYGGHSAAFTPSQFHSCSLSRQNIYVHHNVKAPEALNDGHSANMTASATVGFVVLGLFPCLAVVIYCFQVRRRRRHMQAQAKLMNVDVDEFSNTSAPISRVFGPRATWLETAGDIERNSESDGDIMV